MTAAALPPFVDELLSSTVGTTILGWAACCALAHLVATCALPTTSEELAQLKPADVKALRLRLVGAICSLLTFAAGATTITTPAATDPHAGHDHGRRLSETGFFAFFFEHGLDEIEVSTHYLKDAAGVDVEPVCTSGGVDPHAGHDHRRRLAECAAPLSDKNEKKKDARALRNATLASFLVLACTVVGAILRFAFGVGKLEENEPFTMGVAAFAVGCLLATAFYLLLIEASHLLAVSYQTEVQGNWRFGTCVLAGYLLGMVSAAADPSHL